MWRASFGSSPAQMIAVWSPRVPRCRSRQLAEAFSVPSWYQRIWTSPGAKETSLTEVYVLIQSSRKIGRAHVCTPVTNAHLVCRLLFEKKERIVHILTCFTSLL